MTVSTEMPRTEYGTVEQTQGIGPLSPIECQQLVDDILESLKSPSSPTFNPSLSAELQIWAALKNRVADPIANAIVDMVRAGEKPLHRFFPLNVQTFVSKVELQNRQQQQQGRDGGGCYTRPPSLGPPQGQQESRYR